MSEATSELSSNDPYLERLTGIALWKSRDIVFKQLAIRQFDFQQYLAFKVPGNFPLENDAGRSSMRYQREDMRYIFPGPVDATPHTGYDAVIAEQLQRDSPCRSGIM